MVSTFTVIDADMNKVKKEYTCCLSSASHRAYSLCYRPGYGRIAIEMCGEQYMPISVRELLVISDVR